MQVRPSTQPRADIEFSPPADESQLRRYFDVIRRRWLVAATAFVVTTLATLAYVLPQPNIYEATGTFVVVPRAADAEENLQAFDTLIRGNAINSTYASVAGSDLIRGRAEAALGLSLDKDDATVTAEVQTGTNLLSISAESRDPELAQELARAVGQQATSYIAALNEAYRLQPLDFPDVPTSPVGPKRTLTAAVGIVLGVLLGIGLAVTTDFVISQFARPAGADNARRRRQDEDAVREPRVSIVETTKTVNERVVTNAVAGKHLPPAPPSGQSPGFPVGVERSVWCP